MTIYRKCPFCSDDFFSVDDIGENLYLVKCSSINTVASFYAELNKRGRFQQVNVGPPKERNDKHLSSYARQEFNKLQTPFWKLMGQKPKEKDIMYDKFLKDKGWTYGDAVLQRNAYGDSPTVAPKLLNEIS